MSLDLHLEEVNPSPMLSMFANHFAQGILICSPFVTHIALGDMSATRPGDQNISSVEETI